MKKLYRLLFIFSFYISLSSISLNAYADESDESEGPEYYPTVLQVDGESDIADLESQGVIIWNQREDMVIALIPMDLVNGSAPAGLKSRTGSKKKMREPRRAVLTMDIAKTYFQASDMHSGLNIDQPYTGKGVVVGLCDSGLDPNHINFIGPDGKSRVKRVICNDEIKGQRLIIDSADEIAAWKSENPGAFHGTHVSGIMAGSYFDNGYSGMAPDAEIVMGSCQLYDAGILATCEDIIAYAKSVGKPAVINLSLSSYNGPHDGSTLFNRYLDVLGKEAIICLASGNNGGIQTSAQIDFTADKPEWITRVFDTGGSNMNIYGMTDVWSRDNSPFKFRFHIFDDVNLNMVYSSEIFSEDTDFPYYLNSESDNEFAKYLAGEIYIDRGVSDLNNRWCLEIEYDLKASEYHNEAQNQKWARYNLALEVIGEPGQHADITADGVYTKFSQVPGYTSPNANLSVSDIATGDNVICVGMYNNRSSWPTLDGGTGSQAVTPLTISNNSSYGVLLDGRVLPHTVAPGGNVMSSMNTDFFETYPSMLSAANAKAEVNGRTYYWSRMTGTSMACPYVAGTIACWLEASPHLSIEDVKDIIQKSNNTECYTASNLRNGQGWLQPYQGLLLALDRQTVSFDSVDESKVRISLRDGFLEVFNPAGEILNGNLFAINGNRIMKNFHITSSHEKVNIQSLPKGVYVLTLSSSDSKPKTFKFIR